MEEKRVKKGGQEWWGGGSLVVQHQGRVSSFMQTKLCSGRKVGEEVSKK